MRFPKLGCPARPLLKGAVSIAEMAALEKGFVMIQSRIVRGVSALVFCWLAFATSEALAQTEGTKMPVANSYVVSSSPLLLMFEYANVEFERKMGDRFSLGGSASGIGAGGGSYRNFQAFYRYYPQAASLTGFYVDGRAGVHRLAFDDGGGQAYGLGFDVGYAWLFGEKRNFSVSLGLGATRIFGGDMKKASFTLPTFRLLNIGWSF